LPTWIRRIAAPIALVTFTLSWVVRFSR
jgi:hypothetical protein